MSKNDESAAAGCIAFIVLLIVGIPLGGALYAYAIQLNWNWFATTIGAPRIGFWQAYGLGCVAASFRGSDSSLNAEDKTVVEKVVRAFIMIGLRFAFLVGCGYAAHAWMTP